MANEIINTRRREFLGASALVVSGALLGVSAMTTRTVAADYKQNPFTLVYDGAITANEPGKVNIYLVKYKLNGLDIVANVYTPAGYDPSKTYPALVLAHPNGGVKEQTTGLYAQRLAEQGFITITADAAYQGGSGGEPRSIDKPQYRVEDIHGMADFISGFPGVDTARLGLFGICGGGGYSLSAAKTDKRFKAVATLSMFNSGRVRRNGFQDSQMDTIQQRRWCESGVFERIFKVLSRDRTYWPKHKVRPEVRNAWLSKRSPAACAPYDNIFAPGCGTHAVSAP